MLRCTTVTAIIMAAVFACILPLPSCSDDCKPECTGKVCGDNGCGGTCGFCDLGRECVEGSCVCPENSSNDCGDKGCWPTGIDCDTVGSCSPDGSECYACFEGAVAFCCGSGAPEPFFVCCTEGWYPCISHACEPTPEECDTRCYPATEPGECSF